VKRVLLLALCIFILDDAVRVAHPGKVDARCGITVSGEPHMHLFIATPRAVAAPIGDVFENGRDRILLGTPGQEQACRQPPAVRHGNPGGLDQGDCIAEIDGAHGTRRREPRSHPIFSDRSTAIQTSGFSTRSTP
jgi:hypothetical protein